MVRSSLASDVGTPRARRERRIVRNRASAPSAGRNARRLVRRLPREHSDSVRCSRVLACWSWPRSLSRSAPSSLAVPTRARSAASRQSIEAKVGPTGSASQPAPGLVLGGIGFDGTDGGPVPGVIGFDGADGGPVPATLVAVTVNVYVVPFASPVSRRGGI